MSCHMMSHLNHYVHRSSHKISGVSKVKLSPFLLRLVLNSVFLLLDWSPSRATGTQSALLSSPQLEEGEMDSYFKSMKKWMQLPWPEFELCMLISLFVLVTTTLHAQPTNIYHSPSNRISNHSKKKKIICILYIFKCCFYFLDKVNPIKG